ncbi:hypothetical protein NBG4_430006 [Candidatus Sulfobium mesophilum]|uniref:Uncharacterized protein n=1 Tax=Candidatus Sulfobium mesophilum TaxID=2016548 RepID=A0A2U3QI75_9BACT|nr:hypothetical protein NBG4_430006 [Candidatus Sulfobium mesophilum]
MHYYLVLVALSELCKNKVLLKSGLAVIFLPVDLYWKVRAAG